jgi:hypothetical protein
MFDKPKVYRAESLLDTEPSIMRSVLLVTDLRYRMGIRGGL